MHISIAILLTVLSCLCEILFLKLRSGSRHFLSLVLKVLAALSFCLLGCLFSCLRSSGWLIAAGLFMGLLGDLLLGLRKLYPQHHDLTFVAGALAFSLGHGFYMGQLLGFHAGIFPASLPVFLILVIFSEVFAHKAGFSQGKMHWPGLIYIAIEAMMCALALVSALRFPGAGTALMAAGGLSFLVSDNLLCAYSFGSLKKPSVDWALHATYLAAQLLIGWSILFLQ